MFDTASFSTITKWNERRSSQVFDGNDRKRIKQTRRPVSKRVAPAGRRLRSGGMTSFSRKSPCRLPRCRKSYPRHVNGLSDARMVSEHVCMIHGSVFGVEEQGDELC